MVALRYASLEAQIAERLPELRPACQRYWDDEGPEGEDPGCYIFVSNVYEPYVEILLAMPASSERNRLLGRAFDLLNAMVSSTDAGVRDLALIQFLENAEPWWLDRARPFLGSGARSYLNTYRPDWSQVEPAGKSPGSDREIIDLYDVRGIVRTLLGSSERDVPGISAPRRWEALPSLEAAKKVPSTVAFVSCYGTSRPYVIAPTSDVHCDEAALRDLATHLARCDNEEPNQASTTKVFFLPIHRGERVWQMNDLTAGQHSRWEGALWISPRIKELGQATTVIDVLAGAAH